MSIVNSLGKFALGENFSLSRLSLHVKCIVYQGKSVVRENFSRFQKGKTLFIEISSILPLPQKIIIVFTVKKSSLDPFCKVIILLHSAETSDGESNGEEVLEEEKCKIETFTEDDSLLDF